MKISGILPLRNAVKLGYPFDIAIRSMAPLCDEIVVLVDPTGEDDTLRDVLAIGQNLDGWDMIWFGCDGKRRGRLCSIDPPSIGKTLKVIMSSWDMTNRRGHTNCEISVQTAKACEAATGDWILSLQADEVLHESEIEPLRKAVEIAAQTGISCIELERLYFYGSLGTVRQDWTIWLSRLFKRGHWKPDVDGAMRFDPCSPAEIRMRTDAAKLYHYSRIGDPKQIAERVRNLDGFFHAPDTVQTGELPPYDFGQLRKLDTYVVGAKIEEDAGARLVPFPVDKHPAAAREYFTGTT